MVEHFIPREEPLGVRLSPRLQEGFGTRRQRVRIPPQINGIVEDRLTLRIALQEVNERPGFDPIRVDREEARKAARPEKAHGLQQALAVERGLTPVELDVAVRGHGREGTFEHPRGMRRVPPLGGTKHRTPGTGAIAEVAVVEVEFAEHTILRVEGLDTLVEGDGPQLRVAVHVVEAPVVDVVDDSIVGDGLERLARVLGDKPEHTPPVLGGGMGLAGKVFGIHAEEAGHKDLSAARDQYGSSTHWPGTAGWPRAASRGWPRARMPVGAWADSHSRHS